MKNQRRIVYNSTTGTHRSIKGDTAQQWWGDALKQIAGDKRLNWGSPETPLRITLHVWYPTKRPDLDCAIVFDVLQEAGVIHDDRYVYEKHLYKHFLKDDPHMQDGVHIAIERI